MKKIILVGLLLISMFTFSAEVEKKVEKKQNFKFSLGGLVGTGSRLYQVNDKDIRTIPVFTAEYKGLYLIGTEIGYRYHFTPKLIITGVTQLFGGVTLQGIGGVIGGTQLNNSDMKEGYRNIDDRHTQVEFGLRVDYNTSFQRVKLTTEARGGKNGGSGKISALRPFKIGKNFLLIPQVNLTLFNSNMVNYYFGITEDEVNRDGNDKLTEVYDPNKYAFASAIGVTGRYEFNKSWAVFGLAEIQYVADEIGDSPIVDNRANYYVGVGLRYQF